MKIAHVYSHLNGLEYMLVRKLELWQEIQDAVKNVNASSAFVKVSREKTMMGKILLSPSKLNELFKAEFTSMSWHEVRHDYYVNEDLDTARGIVHIQDKDEQRRGIIERGFTAYRTYNQIDYDLHVKHTFFYERGDIDVGVEIIPTHEMMSQMSTGVAWYENELANIIREGRSNPSVPVILMGIEP